MTIHYRLEVDLHSFATGLPEVKKEVTRRVDRNTLVTGTQLDSTQSGLQNQTRNI
eukprot:COSAG06_NODE_952_length_11333_cov_2.718355_1_plen_54_part_10